MWHFNGFKDTDSILRDPLNSILFVLLTFIVSSTIILFVNKTTEIK